MSMNKISIVSVICLALGCGSKKDTDVDQTVQQDRPVVDSPSPPTPTTDPVPVIGTPEDSFIKCYRVDPLEALQNCSMAKTEIAPEQPTFSAFTVTVDFPCRGVNVAMFMSTEIGGQLVFNEEPYSKTFTVYGKGPLKIDAVNSRELNVQLFHLGCYLKITEITAIPATLP